MSQRVITTASFSVRMMKERLDMQPIEAALLTAFLVKQEEVISHIRLGLKLLAIGFTCLKERLTCFLLRQSSRDMA